MPFTDNASSVREISSPTGFRPTRPSPRFARRFSPLTPIIASPLSTPTASVTTEVAFSLNSDTEDERDADPPHSESAACTDITIPTPTWMSTPPTPPPKYVHRSSTSVSSRPHSSFVTASASFPDPALSKESAELTSKRRASLPPMSVSKPLPTIPPAPPPSSLKTLRNNTSRRGTRSSGSPLRVSISEHGEERPRQTQSDKPPALRTKPLFHLAQDNSDKEDDDKPKRLNGYRNDPPEGEESSSEAANHPLQAKADLIGNKDNVRKCHALSELLSTEVGYLFDLKVLVTVYLRLLTRLTTRPPHSPSSSLGMSHFSRSTSPAFPPPSSNSALHTQSFYHLSTPMPFSPCENIPLVVSGPPAPVPVTKEKDKSLMRRAFSPVDLDLITRNAEEILKFHEQLVCELRALVSPLGFPMILDGASRDVTGTQKQYTPNLEALRSALDVVATKFIERAPEFHLYQSFCSGHPEAFDIVRKVQQEFPAEWEAFEQRCATMAAEMRIDTSLHLTTDKDAGDDDVIDDTLSESELIARRRRHSLSSLDAPSRQQSVSRVRSNANLKASVISASETGHSDRGQIDRKSKLVFMDYLIKPVQRICRYTLLLEQLQDRPRSTSGSSRESRSVSNVEDGLSDVGVNVIQSALNAMRAVASSVDEARRQQDLAIKSSLITSRISHGLALVTAPHSRPPSQNLSFGFLSSLGPCHLAGSLDVIHYHGLNASSNGTVKAKYLGAFLYPGGYLVLAKVHKVRTYEPKHWFSLAGFDLVDSTKDEALLPSWFRISGRGHIFEFAAACRREKDVWQAAIHHVLELPGAWMGEPICSFRGEPKGDFVPSFLEDMPYEVINPLPTIQSIPEFDNEASYMGEKHSLCVRSDPPKSARLSYNADLPQGSDSGHQLGPSRRSSTISNRTYLGPLSESDTIHLVRATAPAREQVDRGLLDVFSESCLSARCYAHTHEEELFEASKVSRSFSRSSSGLTMAGAMSVAAKNRLTKRESVLVPRRKSYVDGFGHYEVPAVPCIPPAKLGKRRKPTKLKIVAVSRAASLDGDEGKLEVPESPSPMSQCSSVSVSTPGSRAASPIVPGPLAAAPVLSGVPLRQELAARKEAFTPKRSRSMVENVRVLFSRSGTSPALPLSREPSESSNVSTTPSLLKWWSKGTLRRRVRSAPDVPVEELPSGATTKSLNNPIPSFHPSLASTDRPMSQPDLMRLSMFPQSIPGSATGEFGVGTSTPVRLRSLFGSHNLHRRSTTATSVSSSPGSQEGGSTPRTVRMRRNLSFLSRLTPMIPDTVLQSS
ncbi:hypothetical protein DFH29DRAFT_793279 [Suillus ampliporus]|nr:hypothetical protein DFH29DRAFT_793279 [Suillus ampliporus]